MALGRKTGGRDFKKGHPGNPNGQPRAGIELKQTRLLDAASFVALVNRFFDMDPMELQRRVKAKDFKVLEMMVASVVWAAIAKGDNRRLEFLLNRAIGKVPDQLNIHQSPLQEYLKMTQEERNARIKELNERISMEAGLDNPETEQKKYERINEKLAAQTKREDEARQRKRRATEGGAGSGDPGN